MSMDPKDLQDLKARLQVELDAYFATQKQAIQQQVAQQLTAAGVQPLTSAQLLTFITNLKGQNVKSWSGNGVSIEFFPPPGTTP